MFFSNHSIKVLIKRLQSLAVLLLLMVYVAANVEFEALHHEFHLEDHVAHTEADEHDPCHLSLYHQNTKEGCHHHAHFTALKKCPLCHVNVASEKILIGHSSFVGAVTSGDDLSIDCLSPAQISLQLSLSRGPPPCPFFIS